MFLAVWVCGCVFGCVVLGVRVCFWMCGWVLAVWECFGCVEVRVCFWLCGSAGVYTQDATPKSYEMIVPPIMRLRTKVLLY